MTEPLNVHATTVAIDGRAVLLRGPSGCGKSDLALRLIDRGARLVSDDRTCIRRDGDKLHASAPASIAGQMEVRGIGIVLVEAAGPVPVALLADLYRVPERLPEPEADSLLGLTVPRISLAALEPSAPIKLEMALRMVVR